MSFLSEILARKRTEVATRRETTSASALELRIRGLPPTRSLAAALSLAPGPMQVIAEIKRASPSLGSIDATVDAPALGQRYAEAGAAGISVLTDGPGFGGSLEDLAAVRAAVSCPLLRKDFHVDPYQLLEARAHGADAVLLIVAALSPGQLAELLHAAASLHLDALVEVHDASELEIALRAGAALVGINNRDLASFTVDLSTSERLLPLLPPGVRGVAESGVKGLAEARRLHRAGARNLLVGEALVRAEDPAALLRALKELT
jgi:indole-3-glycerol phosphate synthase